MVPFDAKRALSPLTLEEVLRDRALRRREFPVVRDKAFFAHAAVCALPARVAKAVAGYAGLAAMQGQFERLYGAEWRGARVQAAALLGARPEEIAFTSSTSAGLSLVARGLMLPPGSEVLVPEGEFPANIYPWMGLERRGVRLRFIPRRADGSVTADEVAARLGPKTRLVSLGSAHYLTGALADVDAIGRLLRSRGVLFCVDAIQSLGALPCPTRHVDFLVADAHKWLLGPEGIAVLYVRRERQDGLFPTLLGWRSVRDPYDFARLKLDFPDSALRYEPGSPNALGLVGLNAALSLLLGLGAEAVRKRILELREALLSGLDEKCCEVLGPGPGVPAMSIVTFRRPGRDMKALHARLEKRGIVTSLRSDARGPCIRLSPHAYNTEEEIGRLLEAI